MQLLDNSRRWLQSGIHGLDWLAPAVDLGIRLWIANIFWKAGTTKLASWSSTRYLFEYEYQVAFLSPEIAAYLGTAVEISMPVLLAIGLATRFSALLLFVFNIIAVVSYPSLNEIGVKDHVYWGVLLVVTLFHGPGKLSIDHLIEKFLGGNAVSASGSSSTAGTRTLHGAESV